MNSITTSPRPPDGARRTALRASLLHALREPHSADDSASYEYFEDGLLLLEGDRVVRAGAAGELLPGLDERDNLHEHPGRLIVPGFVDTHIHYPQAEVIGSYGTRLLDWLERYTFPAEARYVDYDYALARAHAFCDELLRNGTTSALVFCTVHAQSVEAFFAAAQGRRMRVIAGKVLMDRNAPEHLRDTPERGYEESAALIERWHGQARLGYAVTPRFAPTSSARQLALAGKLLQEYPGVHLHTHLSENVEEARWVAELFPEASDYTDVYDRAGLVTGRSVFAHGVQLNERERHCLGRAGAALAFCPTSNLFLGSGLFDYEGARAAGIEVGLGTDVGGGTSFSMLRTLDEGYKVLQLRGQTLDPLRAFYLATRGGARALGLDARVGSFEPGREADFLVLDPAATPLLEARLAQADGIAEKLFALQVLGDDRVVAETWVAGECVHERAAH